MRDTSSMSITYTQRLTMKEVIEIHSLTKKFNGTAYFYNKRHVVSGSHLPKLVSFFLTIKKGSDFLIVVEGENNLSYLSQVKHVFTQQKESAYSTNTISFRRPIEL